jgi:hypothetical protein
MAFTEALSATGFDEFLADTLQLDEAERPQASQWSRICNTIGAMALRLNLMTEIEVDSVLETQELEGGYFGEIAVREGYLTEEQVDRILQLQQLHEQLYLSEQLVVAGKLDLPTLTNHLATFFHKRHRQEAQVS